MKKLIALATVVIFFLSAAPAVSQTFGIGAHAGVSIPMGDYGATDGANTDAGYAKLGFSGGLDLWYPLVMAPGLKWYTSVDAIAHSIDDSATNASGGYIYFPAMTGLRYDIPVGMAAIFVTGQLGVVFAKPPKVSDVSGDITTKFGFNLGAGVQVTRYIYGGLKYYPMGDVEWSWDGGTPTKMPVSFLDIYVGFGVH